MKIIELNIIQFGKFKDRVFTFGDGFNIVKGDNESGKSTLLGFIKFALYGVGRKNPNVAVGERERALSWNVGIAAGSLTVEDVDGKRYRIERSGREGARGAYADKARIIDLENGEEVFAGEVPGEHFLGINAQAYDSMCNVKQLEAVAVGADAVKGVIDNLLSSGDENMNIQSATKMLDAERRRLLHTNGRGGLVYESELSLERLKSEHRGAIVFENECIKNRDELERVELALSKARDEHALAQRMCDVHDDVLRLQKFEQLRELKLDEQTVKSKLSELDESVDFDASVASYECVARLTSSAEALERDKRAVLLAQNEIKSAEEALEAIDIENSEGLAEIIDEHGSPRAALAYLSAKKKKKANAAFMVTSFGIVGVILLVFAAALAFTMNNAAGAMTVAFIGIVLLTVAVIFCKKLSSAKDEIGSFMSKMGEGCCEKDEEKILDTLGAFYNNMGANAQRKNALEGAKFRLSLAEDALASSRESAWELLRSLRASYQDGEEIEALLSLGEKIKNYLIEKSELDDSAKECAALIRSLSAELERFNENDIRARITPEIRERINSSSFERLKAERDAALHRTNQFGQYKAGIERNLASSTQRRSSSEIFPEIEAESERLDALKLRLGAVKLAMETINSASLNLKSDITPKIRERAQKNLATMTAGKYSELYIDDNMGLSVFADGATRPIDALSKGSLDVAYFAVRLALLQSLLGDKKPPLYMDETLSQLDDGRAKNALCAIAEHSHTSQCILFTCQSRDVELARAIADVNVVELK